MDRLTILYLLLASLVTVARAHALTIYGFVPGNNVIYSALYQVPAACMALDDINNSSLLLNYTLELSVAAPEVRGAYTHCCSMHVPCMCMCVRVCTRACERARAVCICH